MRKMLPKLASFIKKHKIILTIITTLFIILSAGLAAANLAPKPLGDKLEYIGKKDYGCSIGFCDSQPGTTYFYATDMHPQVIANYFQHGSRADNEELVPSSETGQEEGSYDIMFALTPNSDHSKKFFVYFYSNGQQRIRDFGFKAVSKRHIVEIDAKDYAAAKESL